MESSKACCSTSKCSCPNCKCTDCKGCGEECCVLTNCCKNEWKLAQVRRPAPDFTAQAWYNGFKEITLSSYKGKYVVLFFYPLDFTFVCPTEIVQFSDRAGEFRASNCEVLACSIDSQFSHMEYTKKDRKKGGLGKMDIPLISDITKSISKRYGCLIDHGEDNGVAFRATYIIDVAGVVRHISISDLPVGRNVDETLRLVKAFQYTDEFGEVCPAQWTPGKATMKTDQDSEKTQQYWENEHGK
jgi:alkyl hydroperoxide reductase subunit AhpC